MGSEDVGVWELPEGWDAVRLGDLVHIKSGFACAKRNLVPATEGVAHLRPFNVDIRGQLDLSEVYYIPPNYKDNVENYALEPGHVLFNNTNSVELVGKSALVTESMECAFSNHIYRLTVKAKAQERLEPAWLALALRRLWTTGYFAERCNRWIGQAGFNSKKLRAVEVPLPYPDNPSRSLKVQRRIMARVEELFARIEEACRLRAAADEDAERIMEAELYQAFASLVRQCGIEPLGTHKPFITSGPRHWGKYAGVANRGPLFLRVGNVGFAKLQLEDVEHLRLPEDAGEQRSKVQTDDVLVTITGTIGRCAVVPDALPDAYINQHTALVRLKGDNILPRYLMWFVLSPIGSGQATSAAYGQTKPGLNLTQLRELQLPVPPLAKQRCIIEHLDNVQAQTEDLKRAQKVMATELERLEQSILARAFRGEP